MRLREALFLAFAAAAHAQQLVPGPERAVSDYALAAAAGMQTFPRIATNGDLSLVAWTDQRDGAWPTYIARVDGAGKVLDPLGIAVSEHYPDGGSIYLSDVIWDGEQFIVIQGRLLTFVAPDLSVVQTKKLDLAPSHYFLAATAGPVVRLLYFEEYTNDLVIVDRRGNVIARKHSAEPHARYGFGTVGGANESGFLILDGARVVDRVDLDGNLLSSKASGMPPASSYLQTLRIAGSSDGFLVLERLPHDEITAYFLDPGGLYQQRQVRLSEANQSPSSNTDPMALVRENDRYLAAWQTTYEATEDWVAEILPGGTAAARRVGAWPGKSAGIALASSRGRRMMATAFAPQNGSTSDLFVRSLPPSAAADEPHLLTYSGAVQFTTAIAAGTNGYAVAWMESRMDGRREIDVRRFSSSGVPQDAAPLTFAALPEAALPGWPLKIVAAGDAYVIAAQLSIGFAFRRLDASTGTWLDPQPVLLRNEKTGFASNGTHALAAWFESCGDASSFDRCLFTMRIEARGALAAAVKSLRAAPSSGTAAFPVLASNGTDYLVSWSDEPVIYTPTGLPTHRLYAARLRSDGTALDSAPLLLTKKDYATGPSVAWSSASSTYLAVWSGHNDFGDQYNMYGTRITAEGTVRDRDDAGDAVILINGFFGSTQLLTLDKRLVLIRSSSGPDGGCPWKTTWSATVLPADADIRFLSRLERIPLATSACQSQYASFAAAAGARNLAVAYTHTLADAGNVSRVFLRLFDAGTAERRRAAKP